MHRWQINASRVKYSIPLELMLEISVELLSITIIIIELKENGWSTYEMFLNGSKSLKERVFYEHFVKEKKVTMLPNVCHQSHSIKKLQWNKESVICFITVRNQFRKRTGFSSSFVARYYGIDKILFGFSIRSRKTIIIQEPSTSRLVYCLHVAVANRCLETDYIIVT